MDNYCMITTDPSLIDYSKVKRFFTFGCSFTAYIYPTWANIMKRNMPDAQFYNVGASGGGNMFISNRITEMHRKFKFTEDDLIMVMWSTHCREDRFVMRDWKIPGNIFSQSEYPESFVKDNCDTLGYLIKDLSIIDLTTSYLNAVPSQVFQMFSVPVMHQHEYDEPAIRDDVLSTYKELTDSFGLALKDSLPKGRWPDHIKYYDHYSDRMVTEYHPTPIQYYDYLVKLGFNMSLDSKEYSATADYKVSKITTRLELDSHFAQEFESEINVTKNPSGPRNWI